MRVDDILGDSLRHQRAIVRDTIDKMTDKLREEGKLLLTNERSLGRIHGTISDEEYNNYKPVANLFFERCFWVLMNEEGKRIFNWFEKKYRQEVKLKHAIEYPDETNERDD